ncbi:MAG: hypothetical protein V5A66_00740 [Candidatus Thermoplasmatota archaeon]
MEGTDKIRDGIEENTLLIACYEKPYSEASLEVIRETIQREKPTKIIILKIIEEPQMRDVLDTRIGKKTKEDFIDSVVKDKRKKVDRYAEDILEITDETDIPTEVRVRKAEVIADEIIEDYDKMDIDYMIIHRNERDILDRLAKWRVEEEVEKQIDEEDITTLE